jgi:HEAT repeat protein
MFDLAHDPAVEVRRRVAYSLTVDRDRPDARETLERLLRDQSASVRFNAIFALGAEHHIDELRRLAAGPDRRVARMAQERLDRIEESP